MSTTRTIVTSLRGRALLSDPRLNKTTAFTDDERRALGIGGLLPDRVETIDEQISRIKAQFDRLDDDLDRHIFLRGYQDENEVLFYRFVQTYLRESLPIVYTPTVGAATQQFSRIYRQPRGLFLSYRLRDRMAEQLAAIDGEVDVIVVTDGERILGLGDQGAGGMGIPIGKLSLYSAFGGIDPARTLPITLDVGTNNVGLLEDSTYLGLRHNRISEELYTDYLDQFVACVKERFPHVLLQWEDFAQHHATILLDRYRDEILSFNDDIQGTAAVALATVLGALRATDRPLKDQTFVIAGAGSAGTGIAALVADALITDGVTEPLRQIYMLDSKGLIHDGRDNLKPHQVTLAHPFANAAAWANPNQPDDLATVVAGSGATVLIGVSGQPGMFTEPIVRSMAAATDRPIILPLSNPTSQTEATPADLLTWTDGCAIVATGSPFADVAHKGVTHRISQANNVYVFPGVGLGVVAAQATGVSDHMLMAAAAAVAGDGPIAPANEGVLPPLESVPEVSVRIARAVARVARDSGLAPEMDDAEIDRRIEALRWTPDYPEIVPG